MGQDYVEAAVHTPEDTNYLDRRMNQVSAKHRCHYL